MSDNKTPKVDPHLLLRTYSETKSTRRTAKMHGVSHTTVRKHVNRLLKAGDIPDTQTLQGMSVLLDADGNPKLTWLKTKNPVQLKLDELMRLLEEYEPKPFKEVAPPKNRLLKSLLSLYTLTDFHLGMYAWAAETGDDWDSEIAQRVMKIGISEMADKAPDSETAILNIQGDFLHWDGLDALTPTSGHLLDADTRFPRMVEIAMEITAWAIQKLLLKHKKVYVLVIEGNHDLAGSVWLRKHLKKVFKKNKRVEVDDTEFPFYAYLHGKTMLGFHHGHKIKNIKLPELFASEPRFRSMWGQANYTYIHTGHYHQTEQDISEHGGAIIERHPTLAARDAYAARGGYISRRAAKVITYDVEDGEVERAIVVPRQKPRK